MPPGHDVPRSRRASHPVREPPAVDRALAAARAKLDRVGPDQLDPVRADGALIVDIRPEANRRAEGELLGAVVVERIHLEWRLDPTSPHRIPEAVAGRRVVVVCNEGYASSLAAASLVELGVDATDLEGGYRGLLAGRSVMAGTPETYR